MKTYHVYTDGSHFKNGGSGRLGIGGLIVDPADQSKPNGKLLDTFSIEINKEFVKTHYGTDDCSNPTMEMLAALTAIREFRKIWTSKDKVILMMDYEGVKYWIDGTWAAKKSYIRILRDEIKQEINKQNLDIEFKWVKGHQKKSDFSTEAYWNSQVDKLAKGESI
jgi:ribonuclease HI